MTWTKIGFGKHKEKTLPQVMFSDPDWFFWAMEKSAFKGRDALEKQAKDIYRKARNIRIPQSGPEKLMAEYAVDPSTDNYGGIELVEQSRPKHKGATATFRKDRIDMKVPREMQGYDKRGYKIMISDLKDILFGKRSHMMTKARCEAFYDDAPKFHL
jgi:hypothetical protein